MRLTLDALEVLDAIERKGSFAAAADALARVPSAITYTVRKLEQDLGVRLFDRRGRRALLTAAGRELLESGRRLLAAAGEAEYRVKKVATGWETELRIAIDTLLPMGVVWPLAGAFYRECGQAQQAHTRLRLTTEVLGGTWDALVERRADLVVGATGDPPPGGGYRIQPIAEIASVFAVAPDHPLAAVPAPVPSAAVRQFRAVVAADSSRHLAPRSVGLFDGQDTLTVPDLIAKVAAQVAGLGCGFIPVHLAAPEIAAGRLVALHLEEERAPARAVAAWRNERPGKALAWWIEAIGTSGLGQRLAAGASGAAREGSPRGKSRRGR